MEGSESALIEGSRRGDRRAFEGLLRLYEQKIYNLLLRMTGNPQEAADLFQETFLSAWKNVRSFRAQAGFSTWLYRIAVNAALMRRRKKKLPTVSMDAPLETEENEVRREFSGDWSQNPLATLENRELREHLERAIQALPEKYKTVMVLSDVQGLPNDETAKILNLSLASVKTRLHRARLILRRQLAEVFKKHD